MYKWLRNSTYQSNDLADYSSMYSAQIDAIRNDTVIEYYREWLTRTEGRIHRGVQERGNRSAHHDIDRNIAEPRSAAEDLLTGSSKGAGGVDAPVEQAQENEQAQAQE
jgi:hypothetical protein